MKTVVCSLLLFTACYGRLLYPKIIGSNRVISRSLDTILEKTLTTPRKTVLSNIAKIGRAPIKIPMMLVQNFSNCQQIVSKSTEVRAFILDAECKLIPDILRNLNTISLLRSKPLLIIVTMSDAETCEIPSLVHHLITKFFILNTNSDEAFMLLPPKFEKKIKYYGNDFEAEIPREGNNVSLSVVLRINEPYVTGNGDGMEEKMIKVLEKRLKFTSSVSYVPAGITAIPYTKEKLDMKSGKVDIFGGYITAVPSDVWDFNLSPSYFFDSQHFICPVPSIKPIWIRLFLVFTPTYYVLMAALFVITSVIVKVFYHVPFIENLIHFIALITENSCPSNSQKNSNRILQASWFLLVIILTTVFKSHLFIIMQTTLKNRPLDTLDSIIPSGLPLKSMYDLRPHYDTPEEIRKLNFSSIGSCSSFQQCQLGVSTNQNFITVGGRSVLIYYYIPRYYMKNGEITIHISKEIIYPFHVLLLFRRGHPLYTQCSEIILRCMANGWFTKEFADMKYLFLLKSYRKNKIRSKAISLAEISYAFEIWSVGMIVAILTYLGEWLIRFCH